MIVERSGSETYSVIGEKATSKKPFYGGDFELALAAEKHLHFNIFVTDVCYG
jgi:hypothetical protein